MTTIFYGIEKLLIIRYTVHNYNYGIVREKTRSAGDQVYVETETSFI